MRLACHCDRDFFRDGHGGKWNSGKFEAVVAMNESTSNARTSRIDSIPLYPPGCCLILINFIYYLPPFIMYVLLIIVIIIIII